MPKLLLKSHKTTLGIDMAKVDVVHLEDSGELADPNRYALSFFSTNSSEPAVTYPMTEYTPDARLSVITAIVEWWANADMALLTIDLDQLPKYTDK